MAAPTNAANVKKVLANPEPSTHDPTETLGPAPFMDGAHRAYWVVKIVSIADTV